MSKQISTFVPWYGSNRMNAHRPGELLKGRKYVFVAFAGGMSEVPYFDARTIVVNDLHRHLITTAKVMACESQGPKLLRRLKRKIFHPDELEAAQYCLSHMSASGDASIAEAYYTCCWMTRSESSGTGNEYDGNLCLRFDAGGGDSALRYFNAIRSLKEFRKTLQRCSFTCDDVFKLLANQPSVLKDGPENGGYFDPPFLKAGRRYELNCGKTEADEIAWHTRLRDMLAVYRQARIVVRLYDHPVVRDLYQGTEWKWIEFKGRDQANNATKPEVLIVNRASYAEAT